MIQNRYVPMVEFSYIEIWRRSVAVISSYWQDTQYAMRFSAVCKPAIEYIEKG
jgi:hypothetical protein